MGYGDGAVMAKWCIVFFWKICSKNPWSSGEYPFRSSHDPGFQSLWTPNPWPTTWKGRTTPHLRLALVKAQLLVGNSHSYEYIIGTSPTLMWWKRKIVYIYKYTYIYLVHTYSIYIHPVPFVHNGIFPCCMMVHCCSREKDRTLNSGDQCNRDL